MQVLRLKHPLGQAEWKDGPVRIGRAPDNHLVINDESLSRHHAEINTTRNGWVIRDLESANGVWLTGIRVPTHKLRSGDVITLGSVPLVIEDATVDAGKKMPPLRIALLAGIGIALMVIIAGNKKPTPVSIYTTPDAKVFESRLPPPPQNLTTARAVEIANHLVENKDRSGSAVADARRALEWAKLLNSGKLPSEAVELEKKIVIALDDRFQRGRVAYKQARKLNDSVGAEAAMRMLRETFPSDDPRSMELDRLEREN